MPKDFENFAFNTIFVVEISKLSSLFRETIFA